MIRRLAVLAVVATVLMASKCEREHPISLSEACETAWKIFYARDGRFTFTDEEIDHMRAVNVDKLSDFKRWFKSECPEQYARTVGGQKK